MDPTQHPPIATPEPPPAPGEDSAAPSAAPSSPCANCGGAVPGRFCPDCGQERRTRLVSLREMGVDFLDDQLSLNSRLPRTVGDSAAVDSAAARAGEARDDRSWADSIRIRAGHPGLQRILEAKRAEFRGKTPGEAFRMVGREFREHVPTMMFLLLPVYAAVLNPAVRSSSILNRLHPGAEPTRARLPPGPVSVRAHVHTERDDP